MVETKQFYEFGEFCLDVTNQALLRDGINVSITKKMFETLNVLVENADRLVEKDELMQKIWHDRFVEESNLTFNIKMLRRALGDSASAPRFIETIPRRGYRFIADVRAGREKPASETAAAEKKLRPPQILKKSSLTTISLLVAAALFLGLASLALNRRFAFFQAPVLAAEFNAVKLSDTGKTRLSIISPNGKYVAYTNEVNGKQSLWLRQLASSNNTQILPPSLESYYGLAFSHDSETLFFTRQISGKTLPMGLFSVPVTGGVPVKITEGSQGWISISPDDKQISFVRYDGFTSTSNHLMMIDVDGQNERVIKTSESPNVFWANEFSPDGKKLAAVYGHSKNSAKMINLVEIDLETGEQRRLTSRSFFNIKSLAWLPDQSGLLFSGHETIGTATNIWQLDYQSGRAEPLTKDSIYYGQLTLDKTAEKLVATTIDADFRLFVSDVANPNNVRDLIKARDGLAFTPDGKIVYASDLAGSEDIWLMDADGDNQRQLTNESSLESDPLVSPDNRFIFFASNRTGERQIWRMNLDGSNQLRITRKEGGFPRFITSDGKWLYFQSAFSKMVMKVSTSGGDEAPVFDEKTGYYCAFSPDGSKMAYLYQDLETKEFVMAVRSLENQSIVSRYLIQPKETVPLYLKWMADGKSVGYIINDGKGKNALWIQKLDEASPKLEYDLGGEEIMEFQFSPDGRTFAFIRGDWKHDAVLLTGLK